MARPIMVYTIEYVATLIGENLELLQEIASNSDNIAVPVTSVEHPDIRRQCCLMRCWFR